MKSNLGREGCEDEVVMISKEKLEVSTDRTSLWGGRTLLWEFHK